jgi:4-alpha-glucanotransferase
VPEGAPDARGGRWRRGPGGAPFAAAHRALGALPLIAEDLGVITPAVRRLRDQLDLPGMVVLAWAFDDSSRHSPHRFENHARHSVIYTATHDQDPICGWWEAPVTPCAPAPSTQCALPASASASLAGA